VVAVALCLPSPRWDKIIAVIAGAASLYKKSLDMFFLSKSIVDVMPVMPVMPSPHAEQHHIQDQW
jgi:hypothetical protein